MIQQRASAGPLALVCVAAPEDAALLTQWETHLHPLVQAGLISVWSELHIAPGVDRVHERQRQFDAADVVLLLLSADFFASPDCCAIMEQVMPRSHAGMVRVIPLLLRAVAWQESPLAQLVPWPSNGTSITQWTNLDAAWESCIQSLRHLLGRRAFDARSSERPFRRADPDWERMLRRLRRSYKVLLDQSLHGIAWVELGLSARPDMISNVTNLLFRLPQGGERLLAPGTLILDVYNEAEGELLILGAPGAGKSTLLLDLAQRLVDRALTDNLPLLPVILRLSSWAIGRPALADWMGEQFARTYDVPRQLAERWVKEGRLLPLLDGLDEVEETARPACIEAMNTYHRTHLVPLVVCSRQVEYEEAAQRTRLALQSAVIVQPLSDEQIEGSLSVAGPSFAGVRAALHQRQALWELAATPLMLSVLLLTYRDASMDAITKPATDLERRVWADYVKRMVQEKGNDRPYPLERTQTWLSWLAWQMRTHHQTTFYAEYLSLDWLANAQQRLVAWLTTLLPSIVIGVCVAFLISNFTENSLFVVDRLQLGVLGGFVGGCLSPAVAGGLATYERCHLARAARHARNAALLGILMAISVGLSLGPQYFGGPRYFGLWLRDGSILGVGSMLSGWIFQIVLNRLPEQRGPVPHQRGRLVTWANTIIPLRDWQAIITLAIGMGLSYGLRAGLSVGLSVGLVRFILDTSLRTLRLAERIHWTWRRLFQLTHLLASVTVITMLFLFELLLGLLIGLNDGLSVGLNDGLSVAFGVGLVYWVLLGLYQGMKQEHLEDRERSRFNQGIRRSLRNGLLVSLVSAIIIAATNVLSYGLRAGLSYGLRYGLSSVLVEMSDGLSVGPYLLVLGIAVMWALSGGPTVLRHYVIRSLLARHQTFPWRAQAFLDDATSRILLRRVGGGYSFIHRRLQDYFADTTAPPSQN